MQRNMLAALVLMYSSLHADFLRHERFEDKYGYKVTVEAGAGAFDQVWALSVYGGHAAQSSLTGTTVTTAAWTAADNDAKGTGNSDDLAIASFMRNTAESYHQDNSSPINYVYVGKVVLNVPLTTDLYGKAFLSVDSKPDSSHAFRPTGDMRSLVQQDKSILDAEMNMGHNVIPGMFFMYKGLGLGMAYEMKNISTSKHETRTFGKANSGVNAISNNNNEGAFPEPLNIADLKNHQMLFGFRGEADCSISDLGDFNIYFEYFTNFTNQLSQEDEMRGYYQSVLKAMGANTNLSKGTAGVNATLATESAFNLHAVHSKLHRVSLGIGVQVYEF